MDGVANDADTTTCTNCGHELRRGMLRCRECGQSTVETVVEENTDEFVLSGHQLLPSQDPKCPLCGAFLEPGTTDCSACTSALLDQLLNGSGSNDASGANAGGSNSAKPAAKKLQVRRAAPGGNRDRSEIGIGPLDKLREAPSLPRLPEPTKAKGKAAPAAKAGGKPVTQFAKPADFEAANQKAVNQHAANQSSAFEAEEETAKDDGEAGASTSVETSAACTALLASLATADAHLRCGIATALGKLGDKAALVPLERHLSDQDVRVRRAVAGALVLLGHPKGQTLMDIAERKPAAEVIQEHRAAGSYSAPKPRRSSGGSMDSGTLAKVGGGILAIAIAAGGIWYYMNSTPSYGPKKGKSAAAKKAGAKKGKAAK